MVILFMAVQSVSGGIAILLLIPLLNTLGLGEQNTAALQTREVLLLFGIYILLNIISSSFRALSTLQGVRIREHAVTLLRTKLHDGAMSLQWGNVGEVSDTELRRLVTEEVGRTGLAVDLVFKLASSSLVLLSFFLVATWINYWVSLAALLAGLVFVILQTRSRYRSTQQGEQVVDTLAQMNRIVTGHLGTLKAIRLADSTARARGEFAEQVAAIGELHYRQRREQAWSRALMELAGAVLLVVFTTVALWIHEGAISSVLVLLYLGGRSLIQSVSVHELWMQCLTLVPSFFRSQQMIHWLESRANSPANENKLPQVGDWRTLVVQDVSFSYPDSSMKVLRDVDLTIHRGKTTALVGQSGCGKSTLVDVALGLLRPSYGHVIIDESMFDPVAKQWRDSGIFYVGQGSSLVPGSVRENLCLGQEQYSDTRILEALELVELHYTILSLPLGLDTRVGDGEAAFSGGELQRLVLARACLQAPDFLILDEATSQVDSATERRIMEALARQAGERTVLIISHRMSTVMEADVIYVMRQGRIVEKGSVDELMRLEQGVFRAFSKAQDSGMA